MTSLRNPAPPATFYVVRGEAMTTTPSAAGAREVVDLWCEAQPFRDHVTSLMRDTGLHWRLIAALAEISPTAMHHLLHGRDGRRPKAIHVTLARALMQVDTDDLLAAKTQRTTAKDSRELLRALVALGHTPAELSAWLAPTDLRLLHWPSALYCTQATRARIQACYDLLTSRTAPVPSDQELSAAI